MPANRADFQIGIQSTFDSDGIDKAKSAHAALSAQLKAMQADIEAAQRTGVSIPKESLDAVEKLKNSVANLGHSMEGADIKTHEVHEALHLVGIAAGQALGPLGDLAHFLGNPYVLAASGAVLAIKMLVEQHQQLRDELQKNITASREMHEAFANNWTAAIQHVTESLAEFHRTLARAGEVQNEFAQHLSDQTALINEQATAVTSLAQARMQLYQANIHGEELAGRATGPEAYAAEEHARIQARAQEEQAEHERHTREVAAQRGEAGEAAAAASIAEGQATSQNRTDQRIRNEAAVKDLTDEEERRKKVADASADAADTAKADARTLGPRPTAAQAAALPGMIAGVRAAHAAGATGIVAGEAEAMDIQKRIEAYKKYDAAAREHQNRVEELEAAREKLSEATIRQQDFEAETTRLQNRAETLRTFADTTNRAADAQENLNNATEGAHGPVDRVQDATHQQERRNYLMQHHDQLTPDEQAESSGAFDQNPIAALTDTRQRIAAIEQHARAFENGRVSPEEFRQLQLLNDRMLGLLENLLAPRRQDDTVRSLMARVNTLESRVNQRGVY